MCSSSSTTRTRGWRAPGSDMTPKISVPSLADDLDGPIRQDSQRIPSPATVRSQRVGRPWYVLQFHAHSRAADSRDARRRVDALHVTLRFRLVVALVVLTAVG